MNPSRWTRVRPGGLVAITRPIYGQRQVGTDSYGWPKYKKVVKGYEIIGHKQIAPTLRKLTSHRAFRKTHVKTPGRKHMAGAGSSGAHGRARKAPRTATKGGRPKREPKKVAKKK